MPAEMLDEEAMINSIKSENMKKNVEKSKLINYTVKVKER